MTGRERRLLRMLCMTASSGGGGGGDDGGDKPFDELTWDQVIASTKTGKYKTFTVGDMKELDLGTEGIVHMQIVGIDVDDLADGSGKAPLTFISKELLKTNHRMNPSLTPSSAPYTEGTGSIGGWEKCEMRTYLKTTIKPLIPENVRNAIKNVVKYSNGYDTNGTKIMNGITTDDVWIPSCREVHDTANPETVGCTYDSLFSDYTNRKKEITGTSNFDLWFTRTGGSKDRIRAVNGGGNIINYFPNYLGYIALGFCL